MLIGADADVYFTGEMSHVSLPTQRSGVGEAHYIALQHEVLAAVASGRHVVLCGHTNTERGYLPTLAKRLRAEFSETSLSGEKVEVHVSNQDRHPLEII
jgi:putative NIF3 family GTP cyclohydrolase 1 type 2